MPLQPVLLPPPRIVPVNGAAAPATAMSSKSMFEDAPSVAMVKVRCVPLVLELKNTRFDALFPLIATVPAGAKLADSANVQKALVGPLIVSPVQVAPEAMVTVDGLVSPELVSKVALSEMVGADAPEAPPVEADQ